ncbi:MAG: DUF2029 domain-containing protein [Chloroflexi bacterium]|nr:DUF2029 domain-containing protein [Chloroflexota bacterium]
MNRLRWKFVIFPLIVFYILFLRQLLIWFDLFEYLGYDYYIYRETVNVVRAEGFTQAYKLPQENDSEYPLSDPSAEGSGQVTNNTFPVPYLPIFVIPFWILLSLDPALGFILYTIINIILLIGYLIRFMRAIDYKGSNSILLPILLSWPVIFTLISGSVNIWLLIFMGEAVLALSQGNEYRSGIWLAGLLLKPQSLILLVPAMLIGRRYKLFKGFLVSSVIISFVSLLIAGVEGIKNLLELVFLYSGGIEPTYPEIMMNFRALAVNLSRLLPSQISWGIAIIGMALATVIAIALWRIPLTTSSKEFQIVLLGTYAATGAVTWHSHTYMALPIVVLLLILFRHELLSDNLLYAWLLLPPVIFSLGALAEYFRFQGNAHMWVGLAILALNVYLVVWAETNLRKSRGWRGQKPSAIKA